jgi:hypothetical protein
MMKEMGCGDVEMVMNMTTCKEISPRQAVTSNEGWGWTEAASWGVGDFPMNDGCGDGDGERTFCSVS